MKSPSSPRAIQTFVSMSIVLISICCQSTALIVNIQQPNGLRIINLGEIQFYQHGLKLPNYLLNFNMQNALMNADLCNDGNITTFCHSAIDRYQYTGTNTHMTIDTNGAFFDTIVVYNRIGYEDRIVNATITVYNDNEFMWKSKFSTPIRMFVFKLGEAAKAKPSNVTRITDVFQYNGEAVAEFHIKYLFDIVDQFIIVESRLTLRHKRKDYLYFQLPHNMKLFEPYMSKIKYVVIDEYPLPSYEWLSNPPEFIEEDSLDSFWRENYQKQFLKLFIQAYPSYNNIPITESTTSDNTNINTHIPSHPHLIWMGDADEIPNRNELYKIKYNYPLQSYDRDFAMPLHFELTFFYYNFNWYGKPWLQAYLVSANTLLDMHDMVRPRAYLKPNDAFPPYGVLRNAGWHLSYFMSISDIIRKIESYAHSEVDVPRNKIPQHVFDAIHKGKDVLSRSDMVINQYDIQNNEKNLPVGWNELQRQLLASQELIQ
jgi:beta-1,4-mannosyl-glycoprotein beta-1,4-N-acetylglucosaminyltransferase